jgi:uncharacterized protein YndB with AHSA1/START domain
VKPPPRRTTNCTAVKRKSECELVVTRTVNGPARLVFEAWTRAELFRRWWVPKSCGLTLLSGEMDVRAGGKYRLVFSHRASTMEFFGTYREVTPHSRLVWTNEEGDSGDTVTTVTVFSPERKSYCPFPGAGCEVRRMAELQRAPGGSGGNQSNSPSASNSSLIPMRLASLRARTATVALPVGVSPSR